MKLFGGIALLSAFLAIRLLPEIPVPLYLLMVCAFFAGAFFLGCDFAARIARSSEYVKTLLASVFFLGVFIYFAIPLPIIMMNVVGSTYMSEPFSWSSTSILGSGIFLGCAVLALVKVLSLLTQRKVVA